tara:strand:+ start:3178 stop:4317 length:1140 start_codon:yes stop_codon:yes gene_type:complete
MKLRKVTEKDVDLLFSWVNDPLTRESAINKNNIKWEDHVAWFYKKYQDLNTFIYILEENDYPIGQIRFDKIDGNYIIDYSIDIKHRKKGYGTKIVNLGCDALKDELKTPIQILAQVKNKNIGSAKVFLNLGFILYDEVKIKKELFFIFSLNNYKEKYIIASEKKWNLDLLGTLKIKHPQALFLNIKNRKYLDINFIRKFNPDKIFFPHWSFIIQEEIFNSFECIVFHMTDLPFGRGGSPLQNLIARGYTDTKLSSLKVVKEIDTGPIYLKKNLSLLGTAEEIFIRANKLIDASISEIILEQVKPLDQEGSPVFFARRKPEDSDLGNLEDLESVFNFIRMLDADGYPKAFIENKNFKLEFSRASLKSDKSIFADVRIIKK